MASEYSSLVDPELLTERALDMLIAQKGVYGGGKVDLLEHGLQTATR